MSAILRSLFALLVALSLAMPANGDPGGENAGGTGVWILPTCALITSPSFDPAAQPRSVKSGLNATESVRMQVSSGLGAVTATFVDDLTGQPVSLPVTGRTVELSPTLLQGLLASPDPRATIVIVDANQLGYVIRVVGDSQAGTVKLMVK